MVTINTQAFQGKILERITNIEHAVSTRLGSIEETLEIAKDTFQIWHDGLRVHNKIRNDKELGYPHRKILDYLLSQYDFDTNNFKEIHFSKLVKESHIGKNMATSYLTLLVQKGYIRKRGDGYRLFYKIRA